MNKEAILHIPISQFAYYLSESRVVFRLRTKKNDISKCFLFYGDRSCRKTPVDFIPVKMEKKAFDELFDWYEVDFTSRYKRICYYFQIKSIDGYEIYYYGDQFYNYLSDERSYYFQLPYLHRDDIIKLPNWVPNLMVYNIFPDSFATGKRYISNKPLKKSYKGKITVSKKGGTINGINENLDYIKALGFNCVYLNPIFTAGEYHKYDLIEYYDIDPCFGTKKDFKTLVDTIHKNGMKIIIDGVFNHCGWHFFAFEDVVKNGKNSKYWSWFYRLEEPVIVPKNYETIPSYECFGYERKMPKLATDNLEVKEYFCKVGEYWVKEFDIDGWRLDVASEINDSFWREFRNRIKKIKASCLLIGEVWETANHWLDGSIFDSTMNYDFRRYCKSFFVDSCSSSTFNSYITSMLVRYRWPTLLSQLNILDSHDVSRFYSLCNQDKNKYHLALVFLMTFCGIPCLFYGDELCLSGIQEDYYRQSMPWEKVKEPNIKNDLEFLHSLLNLRNEEKALQEGVFKTLMADNDNHLLIYKRNLKNKKGIIIFLNNDDYSHEIKIDINSKVLLSEGFERKSNLKGSLSGFGFLIIKEK